MKARFLALIAVSGLTAPAFAAPQHELTGSTAAAFSFAKGSLWNFGGDVGYDYTLSDEIQVGAEVGFGKAKGGEFGWSFAPGFTYNIGAIPEAIFVGAHFQIEKVAVAGADTAFGFDVHAGKRFEIASGISWKPYVKYTMYFKPSPSTWVFDIVPVSLSVHW